MKHNNLIAFAAAAAVLGILAFLAWSFLEVHPRERATPPSQEARGNEYLALDRWIESSGQPVRIVSSGNLSTISTAWERRIFMQATLFHWTEEAVEYLVRWIEEGGTLFLALDYHDNWEFWIDWELLSMLETFGITAMAGTTVPWSRYSPETPSFGHHIYFEVSDDNAFTIKDWTELTRLARVQRGMGELIVSGSPDFLRSASLEDAPNARLAWALFFPVNGDLNAALDTERGWLFIRGATRTLGLFGSLFSHGNMAVIVVSALVLLVVGFWAVIPMFGSARRDEERPGKPMRERFAAEGRFLKRYGVLGFYRDIYIKEIRRRLAKKENLSTNDEITRRLLSVLEKAGNERETRLLVSVLHNEGANQRPLKYRDFPKMVIIFRNILERI